MHNFRENQFGKTADVLFEEKHDDYYTGHTGNYIPVRVFDGKDLSGELLRVQLVKNEHDYMIGKIL